MVEENNFDAARQKVLPKSEVKVECNISIGGEITKVLSVGSAVCCEKVEVLSGQLHYWGNIDVSIVYISSDGEIGKVSSCCPFTSSINSDLIENGQKVALKLDIVECNIDSVSGETIKLSCDVSEEGILFDNLSINSVKCEDDNICCKKDLIEVNTFVGQECDSLTLTSEILPRENIKRIILTESQALIKNLELSTDVVTVLGELVTRVVYVNDNDKFQSSYAVEPFKQEIAVTGADSDCTAWADICLKPNEQAFTVEGDEKNLKIVGKVPVEICVKVFKKVQVEVIKDLYSICNELEITTQSFTMAQVQPNTLIEGKIDGSLTLDDDKPRVDKIMFVGGNSVNVTATTLADGEITIEGIARANVIYLNDEDSALNSCLIEVPFVLTDKFNCDSSDGIILVDAIVTDVDVVVKKGRELLYDAKIKASVRYVFEEVGAVISKATEGERLDNKDFGMELVMAKQGQDAWDIAKSVCVKEELLLEQNPDIVFPLQEDKNLILFYQKTN